MKQLLWIMILQASASVHVAQEVTVSCNCSESGSCKP